MLLPKFVQKTNGRYDYDVDERMKAHVKRRARGAALTLLVANGFGQDAARKGLQHHPPEQALAARPR